VSGGAGVLHPRRQHDLEELAAAGLRRSSTPAMRSICARRVIPAFASVGNLNKNMTLRNLTAAKERRYRRLTIGSVLALLVGVADAPCSAQPPATEPTAIFSDAPDVPGGVLDLRGQVGGSINNPGLQQTFDLSWRRPLSASRHPMWSEAHVALGGSTAITPAHVRAGAWVELAPVSVFVVRAGAESGHYFGTFNSLTSFDSRSDAFDTDSRRERGGATSGRTTRLYVTPAVQFRAGRVIGATSADVEWWSSSASGPFFYEPTRDTLLDTKGDRLTALTSAVLYQYPVAQGGLSAGLMHSFTRVNHASLNQVQASAGCSSGNSRGRFWGLPSRASRAPCGVIWTTRRSAASGGPRWRSASR
jgi:hypothetical protein